MCRRGQRTGIRFVGVSGEPTAAFTESEADERYWRQSELSRNLVIPGRISEEIGANPTRELLSLLLAPPADVAMVA